MIDRLSPMELECGNCMWGNQCAINGLSCAHILRWNEFELTARKRKESMKKRFLMVDTSFVR